MINISIWLVYKTRGHKTPPPRRFVVRKSTPAEVFNSGLTIPEVVISNSYQFFPEFNWHFYSRYQFSLIPSAFYLLLCRLSSQEKPNCFLGPEWNPKMSVFKVFFAEFLQWILTHGTLEKQAHILTPRTKFTPLVLNRILVETGHVWQSVCLSVWSTMCNRTGKPL